MSEPVLTEATYRFFAVLLFLLPIIFLIFKNFLAPSRVRSSASVLPPGPSPWPLIGNVHQMGKKPHISLANFAKSYGPLMSLKLGTKRLIVASSPAAASEILKTYDRILSGRYKPHVLPHKNSDIGSRSIIHAPECNEEWKYLRTLCRTELFSFKAIECQASLREKNAAAMVEQVRSMEGQVVNIGEVAFATVLNTLCNVLLSRDSVSFEDHDGDGTGEGMRELVRRLMELVSVPNISDLYPFLGSLDLQGLRKKFAKMRKQVWAMWASTIRKRRESKGKDVSREQDFLDVLIADNFTNDQINQLLLELFVAGTDTGSSTIEWAMTELIRNPQSMKKVQEELEREIKQDTMMMKDSELSKLPYLQACIKETLRLHPPVPFLIPRRSIKTCQVMNYTIPKNSQIMVNVWAIGRDPNTWEDPLEFKPERFLSLEVDYKGNNFEFLPFGAGRRICPGLPQATRQVPFFLASLIHFFDWSLPSGMDPTKVNLNEKFGLTLLKEQPLLIVPKTRI